MIPSAGGGKLEQGQKRLFAPSAMVYTLKAHGRKAGKRSDAVTVCGSWSCGELVRVDRGDRGLPGEYSYDLVRSEVADGVDRFFPSPHPCWSRG